MMTFIGMLLFAFIGGLILNIMPCVLPVLTLKVFHTLDNLDDDQNQARFHAIAYTLGTLFLFTVFAAVVIVFRASGEALGWGMHFQQPMFVAGLALLIFAFALNSLGVYELTVSSQGSEEKEGFFGGFFTGIFAALMSTPCSAPFLGSAAGFALAGDTPWYQALLLFMSIGFGLAFPFLILGFFPRLGNFLPRPGAWMETFKQIMGFTLLGTSVWLTTVLLKQISLDSMANYLIYLLVLAFALYVLGRFAALHHSKIQRWLIRLSVVIMIVGSAPFLLNFEAIEKCTDKVISDEIIVNNHINWVSFNEERIKVAAKNGRYIFMDFTADWCANCKTNDKLFVETQLVRDSLVQNGILPMKVDMTNENKRMDFWLNKVGRSAIPAYVVISPSGDLDVLPVAITSQLLADHFKITKKNN